MDPAESILSMLDYSFDSLTQDESNFPMSMDMNFELNDIFDNDVNLLSSSDDHLISDVLNDDLMNSLDFDDNLNETDHFFQSLLSSNNLKPRNKSTKISFNSIKNLNSSQPFKSFSLLSNSNSTKSSRAKISINSPKVYVSQSKQNGEGTSILIKKKKNKKRSLLQSMLPVQYDSGLVDSIADTSQHKGILNDVFFNSLIDHNYCIKSTYEFSSNKTDDSNGFAQSSMDTEVKNDLEDILEGFIPDDVVLNELPNCLKDLVDLDSELMLNSEDILHGLSDACNYMTENYIDGLEHLYQMDSNLPNLNITEDDLNESLCDESIQSAEQSDDYVAKDIEVDIIYSPFTESVTDSFDSASTTTGYTEESEGSAFSSSPRTKSKRHRSLSSSSSMNSRRKRRFSTRSSLNSSDSMSDSSSLDSASSSRFSSPERSINLPGFGSFGSTNGYKKIHHNHTSHHNYSKYQPNKKNRFRKNGSWTNKYASKFNTTTSSTVSNINSGKRSFGSNKSNKCQVIDLANQNYSLSSTNKEIKRLESPNLSKPTMTGGTSHLKSGGGCNNNNTASSGSGVEVNEKVLYIGDIPDGTTKSDINRWFEKYGLIEDIQVYLCDKTKNYAFVTYKFSHETNNAIKHGNEDSSHPKFVLSHGRRRNNTSYKDLDLFSEHYLDFRIDQDNAKADILDFDSLLRSTTVESYKLKKFV